MIQKQRLSQAARSSAPSQYALAFASVSLDGLTWRQAAVRHISGGGAVLRGPLPWLEPGARVRLLLHLPHREDAVPIRGAISGVAWTLDGRHYEVRFDSSNATIEDVIHDELVHHFDSVQRSRLLTIALDSGRLMRSGISARLEKLGRRVLFFDSIPAAVTWHERSRERCDTLLIDADIVTRYEPGCTELLKQRLAARRSILCVGCEQFSSFTTAVGVDAIIRLTDDIGALREALLPGLRPVVESPRRPRALFVDDEPNVLLGLETRLHGDLEAWDVVWATSGAAALSAFHARPFDVVVTDLAMPGMTGVELLTAVQRAAPRVRRVVLSGYCALREGIAGGVADAILSKPCPAELLKATALSIDSVPDDPC